jgi:four helix bundle protein
MFGFQRLDVYRCAVSWLAKAMVLAERAGPGHGGIADQLKRAALSITLNIAEGTGRFEKDERRFYTSARGSALECAAVLDALEALKLVDPENLGEPRELLVRIVSMLTKMIKT